MLRLSRLKFAGTGNGIAEYIHIIGIKIFFRESDIPGRSSRISYNRFDTRAVKYIYISLCGGCRWRHMKDAETFIFLLEIVLARMKGDTKM